MTRAEPDDLDRVTPALLRRADAMCPRRLAHEHDSARKPSRLGDGPFEVANRLTQDAITWHKAGDHSLAAFPDPLDLEMEQLAVYRAAGDAYSRQFASTIVEVVDLGWSTEFPELGVRLSMSMGIPVVTRAGAHELRLLRLGASELLVDSIEIRCLLLRALDWAPDGFRIVVADLLEDRSVEYDIDVAEREAEAREWFAARVAAIRARADKRHTVAGADCRTCPCIPGCPQITGAP